MQASTSLRAASGLTCLRGTKAGWATDSTATEEARSAAAARSVLRTAISQLSDAAVYHGVRPTLCHGCARAAGRALLRQLTPRQPSRMRESGWVLKAEPPRPHSSKRRSRGDFIHNQRRDHIPNTAVKRRL